MNALYLLVIILFSTPACASEQIIQERLNHYRNEGAKSFSAQHGKALWQQPHMRSDLGRKISCASCHGADLHQTGKHLRTGKVIEPMAPRTNPARLSDAGKIEKWFKRNCQWTWGRICTAQEKGDILMFLKSL